MSKGGMIGFELRLDQLLEQTKPRKRRARKCSAAVDVVRETAAVGTVVAFVGDDGVKRAGRIAGPPSRGLYLVITDTGARHSVPPWRMTRAGGKARR